MTPTQDLNTDIFKAYDIRGMCPEQLDENAAYRIGLGFSRSGLLTQGRDVVVGRDMRESSESIFEAFSSGIVAGGLNVVDIGLCTTPMLYFAVNTLGACGGAMVTASHNPGKYNGLKLVRENAIPIGSDTGLERVKREALTSPAVVGNGHKSFAEGIRREDIRDSYRRFFADQFDIETERPIVVDAGNGMAGLILPQILSDQKIACEQLFFEPDGRFPNHEANPLKEENLEQLRDVMKRTPGSLGVAFDGDADRVCFIDETGEVVRGDLLVALLARKYLLKEPGGKILYDLRSSKIVPQEIRRLGGQPIRTRVGHALIKHVMREEGALFGGELSYHYYFSEFFNCESGILAMLEVLRLVGESCKSLSELIEPLRRYAHSGEINFRVADIQDTLAILEQRFQDGTISHLDGLSVEYADWWFNIRPSNTEPLLRLNLEADSQALAEERIEALAYLLQPHTEGE